MMKRAISLILCLVMCLSMMTFISCSKKEDEDYKGETVIMYLSENIYDLDPANAYYDESTRNIVSLLFDTLFVLDEKGKVKGSLAEDYEIIEDKKSNEYKMEITLADTRWSDNVSITADDVVFAWKRLLDVEASYEAASLLFDIKNARAVKEGDASIDDLGLYADNNIVTVEFVGKIDYDQFLMNLTSVALAPLRETSAGKSDDWAKKPGTMVCSGPFKLSRIEFTKDDTVTYIDTEYDVKKTDIENSQNVWYERGEAPKAEPSQVINSFIIERNPYYYRNVDKEDAIDEYVTPYRIIVDCSLSDNEIKAAYDAGHILYMGDIPMSIRNSVKEYESLEIKDSLSTHTYYLNQNALINKASSEEGEAIFAIKEVRQALSMAINREQIADLVVFAEEATGIVPTGVLSTGSRKEYFREIASNNYSALTKNMDKAIELLKKANINPSEYSFSITVAAYDDVHVAIAEVVARAWRELGFNVNIKLRGNIVNNDYSKEINDIPQDICDNLYIQDLKSGDFEVIALDYVATVASPYAALAPFAKAFSGQGMVMDTAINPDYEITPHITGYDSSEYNAIMEEIYYGSSNGTFSMDNRFNNDKLVKAEAILMEDMPIIPIVFNQYATLKNESLNLKNKTLWWKKNTNYYTTTNFKKLEVKKYEEYLDVCESYLAKNYEKWSMNPFSDFYSFGGKRLNSTEKDAKPLTYEEFKKESSYYSHLFPQE
ncbi:MAG: hypothetical protein E7667_02315 [Ruminococcaceae bacterium]|nr:hypothetical protein [Oscillospiraceae bacterium]